MAEETHVLFGGKLPGGAALNRVMKELGFPLTISPGVTSLEGHSGYLPMKLRREETGVEFDVFEGRAAVEECAKDADPRFQRCGNFRSGGDENEMLAALCAAAALAKLVDGRVLDEAENRLLTADQAIERARETLKAVLSPPDKRSDKLPGTRPADIKRYLKPLLQQRDDLVLAGRWLFVRPVRHLMRGAFLDRTSDKFSFHVFWAVKPLFGSPDGLGCCDRIHDALWKVWQPHFQGLLMTLLADEVFDRVGKVTTFAGFADFSATQRNSIQWARQQILALVLAGERDRAAAYIEQVRRDHDHLGRWLDEYWQHVSRDIATVCAECHAREAETVKAMKLEHVWEPSPFPAELPASERGKVSEPAFSIKPWVTDPPSPLRAPPDNPGEVMFAKTYLRRGNDITLVAPLTPAEAEERHREFESYVCAVRLPDDALLLIIRNTWWDRDKPGDRSELRGEWRVDLRIMLRTPFHVTWMDTSRNWGGSEMLSAFSLEVYRRPARWSDWLCYIDLREDKLSIHDSRNGPKIYTSTPLSPAQRDAAPLPMPAFGEYAEVNERVRSLLKITGYGEIT